MITVVINGQNYYYPEVGDTDWGSIATLAFDAITKTTLQPVKDLNDPTVINDFTLYNDIDFGPTHGLRVLFIQSRSNNPAATGVFRLAKDELVAWRNEDNDGDNTISFDADGDLIVNGVKVTLHGQIVNDDIAAGAGIEESKLALDYSTDSLHTDIDNHVNDTANPHLTNLVNLVDTTIVTPAGNDTLLYDSNDSKWKNIPNTISNVSDVTVASVADGDVLVYDSNDSDWKNSDVVSSHVSDTNNPHSVTKAQILTGDLIVNADVDASAAIAESKLDLDYSTDSLNTAITSHTGNTSNPHSTSVSNLTDTTITSAANGDVLSYDGSKWINSPSTSSSLSGLSDTDITTPADGDVLVYDSVSTKWENSNQLSTLDSTVTTHVANTNNPHSTSVSNLTDTNVSSLNDSDILIYDSGDSEWKNTQLSLKRLVDTAISSEASGDALVYDGIDWINQENSVDNLTDTNISSVSDKDTLLYDSNSSKWINVENSIDNLSNSDIDSNTLTENDVLVFNDQTFKWENSQIMVNHIGSTANPHLTTVAKLTDASISSASNDDTLLYDSNDLQWKNKPNSVDNLSNVTITTPASGDVLTYTGSGWENAGPSAGPLSNITDVTLTSPSDKQLLQYDNANSVWVNSSDVWSTIEVNHISYVGTTPQGHTIDANNNVTMLATDNKHQILTATDGYNIILPSTGVKAGETFEFLWTADFSSTATTPFTFYVGATRFVRCFTRHFKYIFTAIQDNPSSTSHWALYYEKTFRSYYAGLKKPTMTTIVGGVTGYSGTIVTLPPGFYNISMHYSLWVYDIKYSPSQVIVLRDTSNNNVDVKTVSGENMGMKWTYNMDLSLSEAVTDTNRFAIYNKTGLVRLNHAFSHTIAGWYQVTSGTAGRNDTRMSITVEAFPVYPETQWGSDT